MSSDTKILISYLILVGLLLPEVVAVLNYIKKEIKRLVGEDVWGRKREK